MTTSSHSPKPPPPTFPYSYAPMFGHHPHHASSLYSHDSSPTLPHRSLSVSFMAQNQSFTLLVAAIDGLWFHQIVLFSNPMSLLGPATLGIEPQSTSPDFLLSSTSKLSAMVPPEEETLAHSSGSPILDPQSAGEDRERKQKGRPTKMSRSHSSSSTANKLAKEYHRYLDAMRSLPRSMSYKSFWELEEEEVKGFMDLGFKFQREHLSPRMLTVIPGLQRLGGGELSYSTQSTNYKDCEIEEEEEEKRLAVRPYLSEAWLIKRPDSPLLNLKMPRVSASADMKKHLWHWARTVAYVIHQDS